MDPNFRPGTSIRRGPYFPRKSSAELPLATLLDTQAAEGYTSPQLCMTRGEAYIRVMPTDLGE